MEDIKNAMHLLRRMKDNFTSFSFGIHSDSFHETVKLFLYEIRTTVSKDIFCGYVSGNLTTEQELAFWNAVKLILTKIVMSMYD